MLKGQPFNFLLGRGWKDNLFWGILAILFHKRFSLQGAKRAGGIIRSLDLPSIALLNTNLFSPWSTYLQWCSPGTRGTALWQNVTRLDFPTADSPSRTSLNWHILLAWGCPLGLAVLLLVMARLSEWKGGGGDATKLGRGRGGRGRPGFNNLQEKSG